MKNTRFVNWWKQDKRYITLLKAVLMALLPLSDPDGGRGEKHRPGLFAFFGME
mgnify:CR=1 FL=1